MKKLILLMTLLISFIKLNAQDNSAIIFGSIGSLEYNNRDLYNELKRTYGLDKLIWSLGVIIKKDIKFVPLIDQIGLKFQYCPKTFSKKNIPVTTVDYPDGTGVFEEYKVDASIYLLGLTLLHKHELLEKFSILFGPTIGYGFYNHNYDLGAFKETDSYRGLYYDVSLGLELEVDENYFITASTSYGYFKPEIEDAQPFSGILVEKIEGIRGIIGIGIKF